MWMMEDLGFGERPVHAIIDVILKRAAVGRGRDEGQRCENT